jgi:hypothetical protein
MVSFHDTNLHKISYKNPLPPQRILNKKIPIPKFITHTHENPQQSHIQ